MRVAFRYCGAAGVGAASGARRLVVVVVLPVHHRYVLQVCAHIRSAQLAAQAMELDMLLLPDSCLREGPSPAVGPPVPSASAAAHPGWVCPAPGSCLCPACPRQRWAASSSRSPSRGPRKRTWPSRLISWRSAPLLGCTYLAVCCRVAQFCLRAIAARTKQPSLLCWTRLASAGFAPLWGPHRADIPS